MKHLKYILILILLCGSLLRCSTDNPINESLQITEAGNPPNKPKKLRTITGTISSTTANNPECAATGIQVTDSNGESKEATLSTECVFSLDLGVNKVWDLKILYNKNIMAKASFKSLPDINSYYYYLSDGATELDFGNIVISGNKALPEFEATKQNDEDADGISDFDDLDDDNDTIPDINEKDCDADDIIDDYDLSSQC